MGERDLASIHRDLSELQRLVGGLVQASTNADSQRRTMFEKHDKTMARLETFGSELVTLRYEHNNLGERVARMEPHVEDYKKTKQRRIGYMLGTVVGSGGFGAAIVKAIEWFSGGPPAGGGD